MRQLVASASPFEREIGFSRAVRVGDLVEIAGAAPVGADAPGDVYAQTKRCLEISRARCATPAPSRGT